MWSPKISPKRLDTTYPTNPHIDASIPRLISIPTTRRAHKTRRPYTRRIRNLLLFLLIFLALRWQPLLNTSLCTDLLPLLHPFDNLLVFCRHAIRFGRLIGPYFALLLVRLGAHGLSFADQTRNRGRVVVGETKKSVCGKFRRERDKITNGN